MVTLKKMAISLAEKKAISDDLKMPSEMAILTEYVSKLL